VAGMSEAAARLGSRGTDDRIAAEVLSIIAGPRPSRGHTARSHAARGHAARSHAARGR
jgi:hypothetical protein